MNNHQFHLVDQWQWPLTGLIGALTFVTGTIKIFHIFDKLLLYYVMSLILIIQMLVSEVTRAHYDYTGRYVL